ncbi:hypothetical protein HXX76_002631 [Chlamydomonas incerta]|uniref:Uncharacterized protein n=1 Tax=Chlamydomonas incerta TaxID=51695 RepID=A0A835TP08_CHLIN|nr:hypothetical protein HXX76_002631 [Chlamydomonas incerta]|eukprot:KAG2442545.1 hypothetical protein HXX76_002631 [Chlamydomonas incerta]
MTVADPGFEGLVEQRQSALAAPADRPVGSSPQRQTVERHPGQRHQPPVAPSAQPTHSGTRDRAVSKYLINAIMTSSSWQQLAELADANAPSFNHVHISALVCRLPKLVPSPHGLEASERGRFSRFLGEVSELVSQRLPTFDPRAVANVLWAVCKLGYSPAPPLLNQFLFEAYVRMNQFNAQELANLSWALATLAAMGRQPVPAWLRKFIWAAGPHVGELKPQELAHMAWALSRLCPPPANGEAASAGASPAVAGTASTSSSSSGSPYAESLPGLVSALCSRAEACMARFSSGELVMAVTALHRLDPVAASGLAAAALPHLLRACSLPPTGSGPGAGRRDYRGSAAASALASPSWRCELSGQDLANLWFVLGRSAAVRAAEAETRSAGLGAHAARTAASASASATLQQPPGGVAADSVAHAPGPDAAASGAAHGSGSAVAAAPPAPVPRHHLYALVEVTGRSAHLLTAQGLCMVLVAFARLQMQPGADTARALLHRFHQVLPAQASFQCVSVSLWALARLDLRPDAATMQLLLHCAALQAPAAKPYELLALLWALTRLGFCPPADCLSRLGARLAVLAPRMRSHGLQVVVAAYGAFGEPLPHALRDAVLVAAGAHVGGGKLPNRSSEGEPRWQAAQEPGQPAAEVLAAQAASGEQMRQSPDVFAELPPASAVRLLSTLAGVSLRQAPSSRGRAAVKHSAAQLRARLAPRRYALTRGIERATGGRLAGLSTDALCALLLSVSRLCMRPGPAYLQELEAVLEARVAQLAPWQAGSLLAALARQRRPPRGAWLQRVLAGLEGSYEQLNGQQLLGLVHSLAALHFRPTAAWMAKYLQHCLSRQEEWPMDGLRRLLRSLGELGLQLRGRPCRALLALVRANRGELLHVVGERQRVQQASLAVAAAAAAANAGRADTTSYKQVGKAGSGEQARKPSNRLVIGKKSGGEEGSGRQSSCGLRRIVLRTTDSGAIGLGGGVRLQLPAVSNRATARAMAAEAGMRLKRSLCKVCVDLEQCAI